jgi:carbamoyl-phosphate synthase large subunit
MLALANPTPDDVLYEHRAHHPEWVERVIEKEKSDAILSTMAGRTALNVALQLYDDGTLQKHGVELIGADVRAIRMAEDRSEFAQAMERIGLAVPHGGYRVFPAANSFARRPARPDARLSSPGLGGSG